MDKYSITISQRAFTSLIECVSFVKRVSVHNAEMLHKQIMEAIHSLALFPSRNLEIKDLTIQQTPIRRMIIYDGRYAIVYKINGNQVFIYDILDNRRDNKLISFI